LKTDALGRIRMPREKREALLDEFERSGMSGAAFAKWAGIKYSTFQDWFQRRRRERKAAATGGQQVGNRICKGKEVKWVEAFLPASAAAGSGGSIHIYFSGGVRVEVGSERSAAQLLRELGVGRC